MTLMILTFTIYHPLLPNLCVIESVILALSAHNIFLAGFYFQVR